MHPKLVTLPAFEMFGHTIGPLILHTYGVLLAVAFLAGLWMAGRQAKKAGLEGSRVSDMAVYVLIAGLLGAKLLLVLVEWPYFRANPREVFSIFQSGGVFYGGLLAALPVAWWYVRRHSLPGWRTADAVAPAVVLGQAIGRLGCLAAGCCHGRPAQVPWAITFHDPYVARTVGTPLDVPLHPTQIYEALATFSIFLFLLWLGKRKRFEGQVTLAYIALYAVLRSVIEFFRGDSARGSLFDGLLTTSQFIGILLALAVALLYPYVERKNRLTPPAPPAPSA
jgi:phosphatidylglycerol---prolipoprotein diacylglyceryl transferase